jgi:hypothetical protein
MKNEALQKLIDGFAQSKMANLSKHNIAFLERAKRIIAYDKEGNYLQAYASIGIAIKETGHSNILSCAKRKIDTANDMIWRYEDDKVTAEDLEKIKNNQKYQFKPFGAFDLQGDLIQSFNFLIDTKSFLNISSPSMIRTRLFSNSLKPYKGYIWKYI